MVTLSGDNEKWPCPSFRTSSLAQIAVAVTTEFVCNECGAKIPTRDVYRAVMQMESTEATCPHCGRLNQIDGFSEISAFICRHCGRGIGL